MALVVWWRYRPDKIFAFNPLEIVLTVTFSSSRCIWDTIATATCR